MTTRLRKERVFKHMARDTPDRKVMWVCREEVLRELEFPKWFVDTQELWFKLMEIKHGKNVKVHTFSDYDFDFNRVRFVSEVRR